MSPLCKTTGTSEWVEMPFGGKTGVDPRNIVLDWGGVLQVRGNLGALRRDFAKLHVLLPLSLCCSVDATEEPTGGPQCGRLTNHGKKQERNATMKVLEVEGAPTLCLFALKVIPKGEEILYDYGVKVPWESEVWESDCSYVKLHAGCCMAQLLKFNRTMQSCTD